MVAAAPSAGHHSVTYRQFIVKLHSRCDLSCDYCYVYTMADQRWRERPRAMSRRTIEQVASRIAEHTTGPVDVVLHGGEPLLVGPEHLDYCVRTLRAAVPGARVCVQTNAVRLDDRFLALFSELGVRVGVSLDGDRAANDRHRLDPRGRSSYDRAAAGLRLLSGPRWRGLFSGVLCTVDLRNDPVGTYQALLDFGPPTLDFLLPHGNWSAPPPGRTAGAGQPYADWLLAVFERWYAAPVRETGIRLFDSVIATLLGGHSSVEGIGRDAVPTVVVDTGGGIERSDLLAASHVPAAATGLHVARDPFDRVPPPRLAPSPVCEACPVFGTCGGGLLAHRWRDGVGFANPSVYCADLYALISRVRDRVAADVAGLTRR
jgi:uncharacterized protein